MRLAVIPIVVVLASCASSPKRPPQPQLNTGADMRPLSQRIDSPDLARQYVPSGASVSGRSVPAGSYATKEFYFVDKVRKQEYRTQPFYSGPSHTDALAAAQYATPAANATPAHTMPGAGRTVETGNYETNPSQFSGRTAATRAYVEEDRRFLVEGSSQAVLDQKEGDMKGLSVEQVRELLNRNR